MSDFSAYQTQFRAAWGHIQDPHVRALAWMVTSPGLLATPSIRWPGAVARITLSDPSAFARWIAQLDADPAVLHAALALDTKRRLGHYAENLLAFYLHHHRMLYAHGVQVHAPRKGTVGEFDFLLHAPVCEGVDSAQGGLLHWELATKFYLWDASWGDAAARPNLFDYLGPDPEGSLGEKTEKVFSQQLHLSAHPLAQLSLPQPVRAAQALFKGWLFYRAHQPMPVVLEDVAADHCQGFWCTLPELADMPIAQAVVLGRLQWLAPVRMDASGAVAKPQLLAALQHLFAHDPTPVLVALLHAQDGVLHEHSRGMVVSGEWLWAAKRERQKTRAAVTG